LPSRYWPTALGLLAAAVLGWYLLYSQLLLREMQRDALVHYTLYSQIFSALADPTEGAANEALLTLSEEIQTLDFPIIVTDPDGIPSQVSNLPFAADPNNPQHHPRLYRYADRLAATHEPVVTPQGTFYFGNPPVLDRLRWIPRLQVGALVGLVLTAWLMIRHNQRAERERIWATMARESAHQMATPLSSLAGWVEILRLPAEERDEMASVPAVAAEMEADIDRLEKVAHRFEWIGRPVRLESVDVRTLLRTLERYVRVRMPQLAQGVELHVEVPEALPPVQGNAVLLEWALENLVKNALDALAGAGGNIRIRAERASPRRVAIHIADDGPGVAPAVRANLFEPGVTTKKGGWGVGLSLTRRIVEDVHHGKLLLIPTDTGALFVATLPALESADVASGERSPAVASFNPG
jgi:signal transduction histidine kinase